MEWCTDFQRAGKLLRCHIIRPNWELAKGPSWCDFVTSIISTNSSASFLSDLPTFRQPNECALPVEWALNDLGCGASFLVIPPALTSVPWASSYLFSTSIVLVNCVTWWGFQAHGSPPWEVCLTGIPGFHLPLLRCPTAQVGLEGCVKSRQPAARSCV